MDVLSEVLRAVRLQGALFFNGEFSAPWCLSAARSSSFAPYLCPDAGHLIIYHFLTEGTAFIQLSDGRREELIAGDIVVLPHGDDHLLGCGPPDNPVDSLAVFSKNLSQGLKLTRFGGGGELTKFICGFMACDARLSEVFLSGLPNLMKVHLSGDPSGDWIENALRFSVGDGSGSESGSGIVVARLSEVLFVETLRRYINGLPPTQTGWLAGARDPLIGQALALMHREPSHPWSVTDLAKRVGQSRTRLAERFRYFLGEPPMTYLAQWRLRLGAEILQSTERTVADVAEAVGYGSESTFSRAFRKQFHCPPARFRRKAEPAQMAQRAGASR